MLTSYLRQTDPNLANQLQEHHHHDCLTSDILLYRENVSHCIRGWCHMCVYMVSEDISPDGIPVSTDSIQHLFLFLGYKFHLSSNYIKYFSGHLFFSEQLPESFITSG